MPVENHKLVSVKLDGTNLDLSSSYVSLRKDYGNKLMTSFYVEWDLSEPKGDEVWFGFWISVGFRADRDRLFAALQKQRLPSSKTFLEQFSDGTPLLWSSCDKEIFSSFRDVFRTLVAEWIALLSGIGGVQPFLSAAGTPPSRQENDEN